MTIPEILLILQKGKVVIYIISFQSACSFLFIFPKHIALYNNAHLTSTTIINYLSIAINIMNSDKKAGKAAATTAIVIIGILLALAALPLSSLLQSVFAATVNGTNGDDLLSGTQEDDHINAKKGRDTVQALNGDDFVNAGDGNDDIFGGNGDDILRGDKGNDLLVADDGNDKVIGGTGNDQLEGGSGDDILDGGDDDDRLFGGFGADTFDCGRGTDFIFDYFPAEGDTITSDCEQVSSSGR